MQAQKQTQSKETRRTTRQIRTSEPVKTVAELRAALSKRFGPPLEGKILDMRAVLK